MGSLGRFLTDSSTCFASLVPLPRLALSHSVQFLAFSTASEGPKPCRVEPHGHSAQPFLCFRALRQSAPLAASDHSVRVKKGE